MAMERFNYDEMILLHHVLLRPEKAYVEKQLREMETEDDLLKKLAQSTLEKMESRNKRQNVPDCERGFDKQENRSVFIRGKEHNNGF